MHLKTLSGLLLCLFTFAGTLAAQVNQSIVPEKIVIDVEPGGSALQFTVAVNTPVPVSVGVQLPEEYYVLSLAAAPELSASVSAFTAFPAATNPQRIVLLQEDGTIAEICCDDLPPIGAWLGGTIRAGFEQLRYSIWRNHQIVFKDVDPATIPYRKYAAVENRIGFEVVYEEYVEEPSYIAKTGDTFAAGVDLMVVIPASGTVSMMSKVPVPVAVDVTKSIVTREGTKLLSQFNSYESLINTAKHTFGKPLKHGELQGFINGDAISIFNSITNGGTKLPSGAVKMADGTIITMYKSTSRGVMDLRIQTPSQTYKIRIDQ